MKTAVETVFVGKERLFNRRFAQLMNHHLIEPTACTPAAGWEKGQVENQVGVTRERFFTPRAKASSYAELNDWLLDKCVAYAKSMPHPEQKEKTVFEMFEAERPVLMPYRGAFDGFHSTTASVSKTCLVRFDNNKYSVMSKAVGRPVEVHAYAERIVIKQDGIVVGEHARQVRPQSDSVRSLALRAGAGEEARGAPQRRAVQGLAAARLDRGCAPQVEGHGRWRHRRLLRRFFTLHERAFARGQMVKILTAVLTDGLAAVEAACAESIAAGIASADVIINALARRQQPQPVAPIMTPERLELSCPPRADCARDDNLRAPAVAVEVAHGAL